MVISWTGSSSNSNQFSGCTSSRTLCSSVTVVEDTHWHGDLIADCQRKGQVQVDEEILEDRPQRGGGGADAPVLGRSQGGHAPGGDAIRHRHLDVEVALLVGNRIRQPDMVSGKYWRRRGGSAAEPLALLTPLSSAPFSIDGAMVGMAAGKIPMAGMASSNMTSCGAIDPKLLLLLVTAASGSRHRISAPARMNIITADPLRLMKAKPATRRTKTRKTNPKEIETAINNPCIHPISPEAFLPANTIPTISPIQSGINEEPRPGAHYYCEWRLPAGRSTRSTPPHPGRSD